MALSPSITRSFLEYQKLLKNAFLQHAKNEGLPVVHTRQSVSVVHKAVWKHVKPCVANMLQDINMK